MNLSGSYIQNKFVVGVRKIIMKKSLYSGNILVFDENQ